MTPINEEIYDPDLIRKKLARGLVRSPQLLAGARFLDPKAKTSSEYQDPNYFPFYFYLGQQLHSEYVLQIGSRLGLVGACFLQGCRTVEEWHSVDEKAHGVVKGNLQRHCGGSVFVELNESRSDKKMDTVLVSDRFEPETYKAALELGWSRLKSGGILIADYITSDDLSPIFMNFCRVKNRESLCFTTRYGVGIIRR